MSAETKDIRKSIDSSNAKVEGLPAHESHQPDNGAKPIGKGVFVSDGPAEPDNDPVNGGIQLDRENADKGPKSGGDDAPIGGMR